MAFLASLFDPVRSWLRTSEKPVGRVLDHLKANGYEVLHDLDMRHGHVEHVVVGPSGVYAIQTRAWPGRLHLGAKGKLTWNGFSMERVKTQALEEANYVRRQLAASGVDQFVTAIIALTSGHLPNGVIDLRTLLVVEADTLPSVIKRRRFRLDTPKVLAIADELLPLTQRG